MLLNSYLLCCLLLFLSHSAHAIDTLRTKVSIVLGLLAFVYIALRGVYVLIKVKGNRLKELGR